MGVNRNDLLIPRKNYFNISPGHIRQKLASAGLDPKIVEPVAKTLVALFGNFAADERLNYDVIEKFMNRGGGGGPQPATVVVAAVDALDRTKEQANSVCTGVGSNDVDTINAALLEAAAVDNGYVLLSEGQFSIPDGTPGIEVVGGTDWGVKLGGMGPGTIIQTNQSDDTMSAVRLADDAVSASISDMTIKGSSGGYVGVDLSANIGNGGKIDVSNIVFDSLNKAGVFCDLDIGGTLMNTEIHDNLFVGCSGAGTAPITIVGTDAGATLDFVSIYDNIMRRNGSGSAGSRRSIIVVNGSGKGQVLNIVNNLMAGGVEVENQYGLSYTGNQTYDSDDAIFTNLEQAVFGASIFNRDLTFVTCDTPTTLVGDDILVIGTYTAP